MPEFNATIEYRDITGFPGYAVGSDGSLWSRRPINGRGPLATTWRQLRPIPDSHGRLFVMLSSGKRLANQQAYIHRLVLEAFVGSCPPGLQACHWDDDPTNNARQNLRWDTRHANAADAIRNGKQINGERCHTAKLTADIVREIRERWQNGQTCAAELGRRYGVAGIQIRKLVRRETWKHVA